MDFSRPDNARKINRLKVLDALRKRDMSRAELSRELLINKVSVSEITDALIKEGFVVQGPLDNSTQGRPATILSIEKNGGRVFSFIFSSSNVVASASDLKGNVLRYERFPNDDSLGEYIGSFVKKMTQDNPRVFGVTVIGTENDIPKDVFPWPVIYKTKAEAQAKGEMEGRDDLKNTLFVSWGDEIEASWPKGGVL
ncbi:MAG: winged helix-turn-helix domain-containing protein, partial [Candidatus Ornithospirochaeta sp.]